MRCKKSGDGAEMTEDITEKCEWREDSVDEGSWDTACGLTFYLSDGTPKDHLFDFCCFCGKSLLETKLAAEDEEDEE